MKKWIASKIRDLIHWANLLDDRTGCGPSECRPVSSDGLTEISSEKAVRLNVMSAAGGFVVNLVSYDHKTDRSNSRLFIVKEDEDLGAQLSHIVFVELL